MARFRKRAAALAGGAGPAEHQTTIFERLDRFTRRAEVLDPTRPAAGVFFSILALMGIGLLVQVSHAATTLPPASFTAAATNIFMFRVIGLGVLVCAFLMGPVGVRRFIPLLTILVIVALLAVFIPALNYEANGSRRWVHLPLLSMTLQPSEVARVVMILWVAHRCTHLGPLVQDMRRGYLPMLGFGLGIFGLIVFQPDLGGALLFLVCFVCTMWVGGARPGHVASSLGMFGGGALVLAVTMFSYVRERFAVWVGDAGNLQVDGTLQAMASGELLGAGLTHGPARNSGLQYLQTDYAFSLVGEELGAVGLFTVIGLLLVLAWFSLQLVLSIRDRYSALVAFGLLVSIAIQAMLHIQVGTGLAPPKGMNLPFISDGGSSLIASCLAVGLALGAVRTPGRAGGGLRSLHSSSSSPTL